MKVQKFFKSFLKPFTFSSWMQEIPTSDIVDVLCPMPSAEHQKLESCTSPPRLEGLCSWWKVQ